MNCCRRYLISGRVQGVAFRASTQDAARGFGLTGFARNLTDGRVEVVVCGEFQRVKQLEGWLQQGPHWARVEKVVAEEMVEQNFDNFEVC
ncbi:MAG: acylphosphatase [Acidiferrobacterales bacterium]